MNLAPAGSSGLLGIERGLAGLRRAQTAVASASAANGDASLGAVSQAVVESRAQVITVKVAAKVIEAEDTMREALLDTFA